MASALFDWIRKVLNWCRADALAWSTIVTLAPLVLLAAIGLCLPWRTGDLLRYAGLVLQLLGIGTVAKNLAERGVLFNLPRLRDMTRRSMESFPRLGKPKTVNVASASASVMPGASGRLSVWQTYTDKTPAE